MTSEQAVVESIRRGYGFETPAADNRVVESATLIQTTLANALQLLSRELYNYEGHFLLELLQNADDNHYPASVAPALAISVQPDGIVVTNNEVGFHEENVRAIATIGNSTKRAAKANATGEKGIGFKAVFNVTPRPEIHSNGFHFCFDTTKYGDLGMVVPEWLPSAAHRGTVGETVIVLPAASQRAAPMDLIEQFTPELLLFMRRLRRIRFVDDRIAASVELLRTDHHGFCTVRRTVTQGGQTTTQEHRFFRHEHEVVVSDLQEEKRPGIAKSTVVIAIPLDKAGSVDKSTLRKLFAFLPVKDAGLPFVVHADFVLNTSREDIVRGKPWNVRLRNELGTALAEAVLAMQSRDAVLRSALKVLVKPAQIADAFVRPIMELAIEKLRGMPCIPAEPDGWCSPAGALRHDQGGLSELISPAELRGELDKSYAAKDVAEIREALDLLGVAGFGLTELLKICSDQDWMRGRKPAWLVQLYAALERPCRDPANLKVIKRTPLLRTVTGDFVAAEGNALYRSLDRTAEYGFEHELKILDSQIVRAARSEKVAEEVSGFLDRLQIYDATAGAIVAQYIIPRQNPRAECTVQLLVAHARYLRDHLKEYLGNDGGSASRRDHLAEHFHLLVGQGSDQRVRRLADRLYLGDRYNDPNGMQKLFGAKIAHQLISPDYLDADPTPQPDEWRELFLTLGASEMPQVHWTPWGCEPSEEFAALLAEDDPEQNEALLRLLDKHWRTWVAPTMDFADSELCGLLQGLRVPSASGEAVRISAQYRPSEDNKAVFGDSVSYQSRAFRSDGFSRALGVVDAPSVEQVLARLEALSEAPPKRLKSIGKLYRYLEQHWDGHADEIKQRFSQSRLIFCKTPSEGVRSRRLKECCWSFPSKLWAYADVGSLERDWSDYKEFFRSKLHVRSSAQPEEVLQVLERLSDLELEADEARALALDAYSELERVLRQAEDGGAEEPAWIRKAKDSLCILTTKGDWWRNDDDVFAEDDGELSELFFDCENIRFICIPRDRLPKFHRLLRVLGIRPASDAERHPPPWRDGEDVPELTARLRERWHHLARIAFVKAEKQYERIKEDGRLLMLRSLTARSFKPLALEVQLAGETRQCNWPTHLSSEGDESRLFVDQSHLDSWICIASSIDQFLGLDGRIEDLLTMVLGASDDRQIQSIFSQKRLTELPQGEIEEMELVGDEIESDPEPLVGNNEQDSEPQQSSNSARAATMAADGSKPQDTSKDLPGTREASSIERQSSEAATARKKTDSATPSTISPPANAAARKTQGSPRDGRGKSSPSTEGSSRDGRKAHTPPTKPDRSEGSRAKQQRRPGRLISYVETNESTDPTPEASNELQERREETDEAAVRYVVLKELDEGRIATVMPHSNPGYDIESKDANGDTVRFIEVKGLGGEWGERGVTMSNVQFDHARSKKDRAWLYVVEFAADQRQRRLWRIQDPVSKANKFGFDYGWRQAGDEAPPPTPAEALLKPGVSITMSDGSIGTVVAVKAHGSIYTVTCARADGTRVNRSGPIGMFSTLIRRG
ncbi:MAG: hypothetical protein RLZZ116_1886 [Planctomycetota bacterium]|jgi:hypothetical protein